MEEGTNPRGIRLQLQSARLYLVLILFVVN